MLEIDRQTLTQHSQNLQNLQQQAQTLQGQTRQSRSATGNPSQKDLGFFRGDYGGSFDEFFEHFELLARANDWPDAEKLVKLPWFLRGNALDVYRELPVDVKQNYGTLRRELAKKLQPPQMGRFYARELHQRKQQPGELVVDYARALQRLGRAAYPNMAADARDSMLVGVFVSGLQQPIQQLVAIGAEPESLDAAIMTAKRHEAQWMHQAGVPVASFRQASDQATGKSPFAIDALPLALKSQSNAEPMLKMVDFLSNKQRSSTRHCHQLPRRPLIKLAWLMN